MIYMFIVYFVVIFPAAFFEWFDSVGMILWIVLAGAGLHSIGWLWWFVRGRERFPLNS